MSTRMLAFTALVLNTLLAWILLLALSPGWRSDGPLALLPALVISVLTTIAGWLTGWAVNGLVVFPKHRFKNYIKGFAGATLVCLALAGWYVRYTEIKDRGVETARNEAQITQPLNGEDDTRTDLSLKSFQAIERSFPNPNRIHLVYHFATNTPDSLYTFFFLYKLAGDPNHFWYAKVDATPAASIVRKLNAPAEDDNAFTALYEHARSIQRAKIDNLLHVLNNLPDSEKTTDIKETIEQLKEVK